jgi:hypothetical protein
MLGKIWNKIDDGLLLWVAEPNDKRVFGGWIGGYVCRSRREAMDALTRHAESVRKARAQ